jgi:hypothetical protein
LDPTSPVYWELPELVTTPTLLKRINDEADLSAGSVCEKATVLIKLSATNR